MIRRLREPMTVEQLKKHMDRRLRTKADKADVRRLERRMNERFAAVDERFAAVDARFVAVDARFDRIDARFGEMMRQFDGLRQQLNGIASGIHVKLDKHERLVNEFQGRLTDLERGSIG
ncbi:MAG: hypothetical protein LAO77_09090 [Acidobacteriia bacterium]|nr:hypothetical protein [Terriglobia bacterium]